MELRWEVLCSWVWPGRGEGGIGSMRKKDAVSWALNEAFGGFEDADGGVALREQWAGSRARLICCATDSSGPHAPKN